MASREHGFGGIASVEQSALYALRAPREFCAPDTAEHFPPDLVVDWSDLTLVVDVDVLGRRIKGAATWQGTVRQASLQRLRLDADSFEVLRVFDGAGSQLGWHHDGRSLWVELGKTYHRGELLRVAIDFDTREPRAGFYFVLPDADHPDRPAHAWTQGQDEDSKYWFPCHDSPNHKVRLRIVATVPEGMVALSNGRLRSVHGAADAGQRIFDWQLSRPAPMYLLTLVVGPFVEVVQQREPLPISYAVLPGREADGARSFGRTPEMVAVYERLTGVPYPFEKYSQVAVSEFVFGGMENASMTTQTDLTLHDARAHLDFSSEPLVSHELAHQWFGDLVTCRSWTHGWLNEGFATYFEQLWQEHGHSVDDFDYARQQALRVYLAEDSGRYRRPIVTHRYDEPIDLFDAHLYEKGAAVLHMLRRKLGDDTFFGAVSAYLRAFADQTAETVELRRVFETFSGVDLGRFFAQWVEQGKGHPELKVSGGWEADSSSYRIAFEQTQDRATAPIFHFEVAVHFVLADGATVVRTAPLQQARQIFFFALPAAPELVLVDPRGDLLAVWDLGLPEPLLRAQLRKAPSPWARWTAAHALAKQPSAQNVAALAAALRDDPAWMVQLEVARALGKTGTSAAYAALAASVGIDHPKARRAVREALGHWQTAEAGALLADLLRAGDASVLVEAETARALGATRWSGAWPALGEACDRASWNETVRVGVLDGLAALQDPRAVDLAAQWLAPRFPTLLRCAAIRCLCALVAEPAAVLRVLQPYVADTSFRFAFNLAASLGNLGDARAIALLQTVAERAVDGRVKKRATESIAALRAGLSAGQQVQGLRGDLDAVRNQLRDLSDTVQRTVQLRRHEEA